MRARLTILETDREGGSPMLIEGIEARAIIDSRGVVRDHIGRHVAGRMDGTIPPAASPTLFARLGNFLALGWAAILLLLGLVVTRQRDR